MERLTIKSIFGGWTIHVPRQEAIDRLAAYEDAMPIERAQELAQAEKDGRLVVHGKWIDKGWDGDFNWRIDGHGSCWKVIACSVCGENLCGSTKTSYCPHCGAKMDLQKGGAEKEGGGRQ